MTIESLRVRQLSASAGDVKILDNVSFMARMGEFHGVLGPSGAGKSTLFHYIGGRRVQVSARGRVEVDGVRVDRRHLMSKIAYLEQNECLLGSATVRETLTFVAKLQLKESEEVIKERVENTIEELGISHRADALVGDENIRGLSGGEKRRVSIGEQLVKDPDIFLLDEPTSGLDSHVAYSIVTLLRKIASKQGKIILATLHQPSSRITAQFDRISLMAGGRMVYSGELKETLSFFAAKGHPCKPMFNPSDHFLDIISDKKTADTFADAYALIEGKHNIGTGSSAKGQTAASITGSSPAAHRATAIVSWCEQFRALALRRVRQWWRDPVMLVSELAQYIILGLFLGSLFRPLSQNATDGPFERYSAIFFILACLCFTPMFTVITYFEVERPLLRKETATRMYTMSAYYIAMSVVVLLVETVLILLFSITTYYLIGFRSGAENFFLHYLVLWLFMLICETFGLIFSALCPSTTVAIIAATGPVIILMSLSGFLTTSTPVYYEWTTWINFFHYTLVSLIDIEMRGQEFTRQDGSTVMGEDLVRDNLKNGLSLATNIAILIAYLMFFRIIGYLLVLPYRNAASQDDADDVDKASEETNSRATNSRATSSSAGDVAGGSVVALTGPNRGATSLAVMEEGKTAY